MKICKIPESNCTIHYKTSIWREIRSILLKISSLFWKIISHFQKDLPKYFEKTPDYLIKHEPYQTGVFPIFKNVFDRITKEKGKKETTVLNLLYVGGGKQEKKENTAILIIPLILTGFFINHIICFTFYILENRIEFFDSQGKTFGDKLYDKVWGQNKSVVEVIIEIWKKFKQEKTKKTPIFSNKNVHQYDERNCGPRALCEILRILDGESRETRWGQPTQDPRIRFLRELQSSDISTNTENHNDPTVISFSLEDL